MKTIISGQVPDLDIKSEVAEGYSQGVSEISDWLSSTLYQQVQQFAVKVSQYCEEFDMSYEKYIENSYAQNSSVLSKMARTISSDLSWRERGVEVRGIVRDNIYAKDFIKIMQRGHSLLLEVREAFTGQTITTKFIVQHNGQLYEINSTDLEVDYVLSSFGGGTISNPFSLAYELNMGAEELTKTLASKGQQFDPGFVEALDRGKDQYLKDKAQKNNKSYEARYDSVDAEIYERYRQGKLTTQSLQANYGDLRQEIKKNNTAFYKMGDVGQVQIKFFNADSANGMRVNFARFSLLRDRLRELAYILGACSQSPSYLKEYLINFFVESSERVVVDGVSDILSKEAQKNIEDAFKSFI